MVRLHSCRYICVVVAVVAVVVVANNTSVIPQQSDTLGQLVPFPLQAIIKALNQQTSLLQNMSETMGNLDEKIGNMDEKIGNMDEKIGSIDEKTGEIKKIMQERSRPVPGRILEEGTTRRPRNCQELLKVGDSGRGVRQVYPFLERPNHDVDVYCYQDTDGGGWLVFQRRLDLTPREDFYRNWTDYEAGFGNITGEFWIGLNLLYVLASSSPQQMRVELSDWEGERRWAKYGVFRVGPPEDNYRLTVDGYTGDAGDSMTTHHNGSQFTTHDADNDNSTGYNCAEWSKGGWWYYNCYTSNPNGMPIRGRHENKTGINWNGFKGDEYSLKTTTFMIKPAPLTQNSTHQEDTTEAL